MTRLKVVPPCPAIVMATATETHTVLVTGENHATLEMWGFIASRPLEEVRVWRSGNFGATMPAPKGSRG